MWYDFWDNVSNFGSINLTQLNATASFLKRIDTKYLITEDQLAAILEDLRPHFDVLEIDSKRIFSYDNVYMDSADYLFYHQHEAKKESRTKIRTRLYKDCDMAFFEYKQKQDGITKKFRYEFPSDEHGVMTKGKKRFFEWVWQSMYYGEKAPKITPSLKTTYNRLTLISKSAEERLTIDFNIRTLDLRNETATPTALKNLVIIESKSLQEKCLSAKIIQSHDVKQAKSCSKYSLWIVYSGLVEKWTAFTNTIEKIKEIRTETIKNNTRKKAVKQVEKTLNSTFTTTPLSLK